jgi:hypothetical protein
LTLENITMSRFRLGREVTTGPPISGSERWAIVNPAHRRLTRKFYLWAPGIRIFTYFESAVNDL